MSSFNKAILLGRLTANPKMNYPNDMAIANFSLAVNRKSGKDKKEADFINITVFGKLAEVCAKYLFKGSECLVSGEIRTDNYTNNEGKRVYTTKVIANEIQILTWNNNSSNSNQGNESNTQGYNQNDSNIPF